MLQFWLSLPQNQVAALRAFDRKRILDRIEEQLAHQPTVETPNKKILAGLTPPWEHEPPVRQLRVEEYRVFYDVDEPNRRVIVRAIRKNTAHHYGGDSVKTIPVEQGTLDDCVRQSYDERVLITRDGLPVAVVVGVEGLDAEQIRLGCSDDFWKRIIERRQQKTLTRKELEEKCDGDARCS